MPRTIMEAINDILTQAGGTPTGGGGSIVDKLNQVITQKGGEAHPAATIEECVREIARLDSESEESGL